MKQIVCSILSVSMMFTTSCGMQTSGSSQKPLAARKADPVAVQNVQTKIDAEQANVAATNNVQAGKTSVKTTAQVNAAVASLMKTGDLHIKDFEGKSISAEEYQLNPSQYFLLYRKSKTATEYQALNTSVDSKEGASEFVLNYKIYGKISDPAAFKGANLGEPKVVDSLKLSTSPLALMQNKAAINEFMNRITSAAQIAAVKGDSGVMDLLFPKAFADYRNNLMITAIVFSSVSVLSFLFAWYGFGAFTGAVGITFWLLFWFTPDTDDEDEETP